MWSIVGQLTWLRLGGIVGIILIPLVGILLFSSASFYQFDLNSITQNTNSLIDRVFSLPVISNRFISQDLLVLEDKDTAKRVWNWRDLNRALELVGKKLRNRIRVWYLLAFSMTSMLLGFGFITFFIVLYWFLLPEMIHVGWINNIDKSSIQISTFGSFSYWQPIPKVALFLASIQVAVFLASLVSKPDDNEFLHRLEKKIIDWFSAAALYQAVWCPYGQLWDEKIEPMINNHGKALRAKLVVPESTEMEVARDNANNLMLCIADMGL